MFDLREKKFLEIVKKKPISYLKMWKIFQNNFIIQKNFDKFISDLEEKKLIYKDRKTNVFFYLTYQKKNIGFLIKKSYKFGFIKIENSDDSFFINSDFFYNALDGDKVEFSIYKTNDTPAKNVAFIEKIIDRKRKFIVGFFKKRKSDNKIYFYPINIKEKNKFLFDKTYNLKEKENQIWKAEIIPKNDKYLTLKLAKKIANLKDPFADVNSILLDNEFDLKFNKKVLEQANLLSKKITEEELKTRINLENEIIFTIDGDDTKDFDDAISIEKNNDNFNLKVHIADVSFFVDEGSLIDSEALRRANSVYLPHMTINMLPEKLSNDLCSLVPDKKRLTLTADMKINFDGNVVDFKIYKSLIKSKKRLTYSEVNQFLKNKKSTFFDKKISQKITLCQELSKILSKYNENLGYEDFEISEQIIKLDKKGKVISINTKNRGISEIIIENFMIKANESVAKFLTKKNIPTIYRIHKKPDLKKINFFNNWLNHLNFQETLSQNPSSLEFAKIVRKIKKNHLSEASKNIILKTMERAIYSETNYGHFGLGLNFYSHFTSPIRRYSDLLLHRIIYKNFFNLKEENKIDTNKIKNIAQQCSVKEKLSIDIERTIKDYKKTEFYQNKIDLLASAEAISITSSGIFLEDLQNKTSYFFNFKKSNIKKIEKINDFEISINDKKVKIGKIYTVQIKEISLEKKKIFVNLKI